MRGCFFGRLLESAAMVTDFSALRDRYSSLSDDELQNLAVSGGITEEALQTLTQELRRRGIHDTTQYQQHLETLRPRPARQ